MNCKEAPGPRCYFHVSQELDKIRDASSGIFAASEQAHQAMDAAVEAARSYREQVGQNADPEVVQANIAALKAAEASIADTSEAARRIRETIRAKMAELDATAEGMQMLTDEITEREANGGYTEELTERLRLGTEAYEDRIRRYDAEFKTVNMMMPSLDGNDEGIAKLTAELETFEEKLNQTQQELLATGDAAKRERLQTRLENYGKKIQTKQKQLAHAEATAQRIKDGVIGDPRKVAKFREAAAKSEKRRQDSIDRSDSDGFASQWASGLSAQEALMKANLEENAGKAEFNALFDKAGNMVPAKLIPTQYGSAWARYTDPHDSSSKFTGEFISESKSSNPKVKANALAKKGYTMGLVKAPAYVAMRGETKTSVRPTIIRSGKDIFKDCEIITKNIYEEDGKK